MSFDLMVSFFVFIFGLIIGSFLNCLVYRLEKDESLKGRSYCPHCKHTLSWLDLIPVFSFLWLGGKCRYCRKKISFQYPLIEIVTALLFLLIFNYQLSIFNQFSIQQFLNLVFWFYIVSSLIVIFVYDLKHYLIPDQVLFPAIGVAFVYHFNFNYFLSALIASGFFLTLFLMSRGRWMGFGDVKLAILLGLLLGFPNILVGLFLSFLLGSILGITLMGIKSTKIGLKSELPFAPFLIIGTLIALFWGEKLIDLYTKLFIFQF